MNYGGGIQAGSACRNQGSSYGIEAMKNKPIWDKPNPKKESSPLSDRAKQWAKSRAKVAGRPYPNAVDNISAARKFKIGV